VSTLVVIPVRGLTGSKSRLAPLFDSEQRTLLVRAMLEHMVSQVPAGADLAVITRNTDAAEGLGSGVQVLAQRDDFPGLNGSLQQALWQARDAGYADMLMLPGDLPLVSAREIESLLLEEGTIVLAGDRDQEGTNGLRVPTRFAETFTFGMGTNSFVHHLAEARMHGTGAITVYHRGLAHDLDTPDDWHTLPLQVRDRLIHRVQPVGKGA
jgi:2-phospho-L-lactate guanylyltransferase